MTIAFAIIFSVVLAISVWLIEKRSAWKKAGKFFLYGLGVVVVVPLLGWGGYVVYEDIGQLYKARLVSNGSINTYLDVRLGMKEEEVRYRLGEPTDGRTINWPYQEIPADLRDNKTTNGGLNWTYQDDNSKKSVLFVSGSVADIVCQGTNSYSWYSCSSLVGVQLRDTEEEVLSKLGTTTEPPNFEDGEKRLRFGPENARITVWLRQDRVFAIWLSDGL
jgi:hypothetical protein